MENSKLNTETDMNSNSNQNQTQNNQASNCPSPSFRSPVAHWLWPRNESKEWKYHDKETIMNENESSSRETSTNNSNHKNKITISSRKLNDVIQAAFQPLHDAMAAEGCRQELKKKNEIPPRRSCRKRKKSTNSRKYSSSSSSRSSSQSDPSDSKKSKKCRHSKNQKSRTNSCGNGNKRKSNK